MSALQMCSWGCQTFWKCNRYISSLCLSEPPWWHSIPLLTHSYFQGTRPTSTTTTTLSRFMSSARTRIPPSNNLIRFAVSPQCHLAPLCQNLALTHTIDLGVYVECVLGVCSRVTEVHEWSPSPNAGLSKFPNWACSTHSTIPTATAGLLLLLLLLVVFLSASILNLRLCCLLLFVVVDVGCC